MPLTRRYLSPCLVIALSLALCAPASTQSKPTIKPADFGKMESLGQVRFSRNGEWIAFGISRGNGSFDLRYRKADADKVTTVADGQGPVFSRDSKWLAYTIAYSQAERDKAAKTKRTLQNKIEIVELASGKLSRIENVSSFSFAGAGNFLAMRRYPPSGRTAKGSDLVVRNLAETTDTNLGNVAAFSWQEKGDLLAVTIDAEGKAGNGVQVYDPGTGLLKTLESGEFAYSTISWRKKSSDLAFFRSKTDEKREGDSQVVVSHRDIAGGKPVRKFYDHASDSSLPADLRVLQEAGIAWAEDGAAVRFGVRPWDKKPEKPKAPEPGGKPDAATAEGDEPSNVEVWHAKDLDILPEQKLRTGQDKARSMTCSWQWETGKVVRLEDDLKLSLSIGKGDKFGVISDSRPYLRQAMFGPDSSDLYTVDLKSGARKLARQKVQFDFGTSPGGKYALFFDADSYWTIELATGQVRNITKGLTAVFTNVENDHTLKQKPPFFGVQWTKDDASVLLPTKYDIWEVSPTGSGGTARTSGLADQVVHRYLNLDDEDDFLDFSKPNWLTVYGERTKRSGFARQDPGKVPERVVWLDKRASRLSRAADSQRFAYVTEDFNEPARLHIADAGLKNSALAASTNEFLAGFAWGRSQLIDYTAWGGKPLQGALIYPANYDASKKYPMIVYIYEKMSQNLHAFIAPSETDPYNESVWSADGYFVLMPDIVYRDRQPGLSAVDCIVPAVKAALGTASIDPKKVGLVGHSWGAYQTAFVVTQTDMFTAAVAGAPLTNLISMYLSVYWNAGVTDARIFEISQGRMEVPFYEDTAAYVANSPIFHIQKLNTPLMVAFGDQDGAVDWNQGVELYNAARRADKNLVMLVYPGENHGLAKKPNQIDYHKRIKTWFGHYLQGAEAPTWITEGQSALEREKALERAKPSTPPGGP